MVERTLMGVLRKLFWPVKSSTDMMFLPCTPIVKSKECNRQLYIYIYIYIYISFVANVSIYY